MLTHDISFGIGPAGTGKTFLAVACAVDALERNTVQRIVLTRPAVEAGERLGFLPGDLAQKVDPYLRPLYDALYDLMGLERVTRAFDKGLLEIAPLAFMRGRTLNHAFVILDEAQNTTLRADEDVPHAHRLRLALRGHRRRQPDRPAARAAPAGWSRPQAVLAGVEGVAFTQFTAADVVRHPLVARIVEAYDAARTRGDGRLRPWRCRRCACRCRCPMRGIAPCCRVIASRAGCAPRCWRRPRSPCASSTRTKAAR